MIVIEGILHLLPEVVPPTRQYILLPALLPRIKSGGSLPRLRLPAR